MLADRLRGDSIAYGISMVLVRGLAFLALVVFARMLAPEQLGVYNILVIASLVLGSVASMELAQAVMRYCAGPPTTASVTYYATAFWFVTATSLLCAGTLSVFSLPLSRLLFGDERWAAQLGPSGLWVAASAMLILLQSLCRSELRRAAFTACTITWALSSIGFSILLALTMRDRLAGVIVGQALGALAGIIVAMFFLGLPRLRDARASALRELLHFSAPLVISVLSLLCATYVNRILLTRWGTLEQVAAFTVAAQVANVATLALLGIQSALGPLVLAHHNDPETPAQVASLFGRFWVTTMGLCLLLGVAAEPLVALVFPPAYRASAPWIFPLSVATVLSQAYVFWPGFSISRWTMGQMLVTIGSGVAGVALNVVAVMLWGVQGAVAGAVGGSAVFLVSWIFLSNRRYRIPVSLLRAALVSAITALLYQAGALHGTLRDVDLVSALRSAAAVGLFMLIGSAAMSGGWRWIGQRYFRKSV